MQYEICVFLIKYCEHLEQFLLLFLVSVARAVELQHNPSLISALANETAKLFHEADAALSSLDDKVAGQWRKYLQLKDHFYMAYVCSLLRIKQT